MKYVPKSVSRAASRGLLKLNKNSPTILVVTGVVGFGATAVMAAKATRRLDPILESHKDTRALITSDSEGSQREIVKVYANTTASLTKLYGPTLVVGTASAASILYGHKILKGRHVATLLAYSGLQEQFASYRERVSAVIGEERERDLHDGAMLQYEEDPNHKGEYKLVAKYPEGDKGTASYLRPFFDEVNKNWTPHAETNYQFLKAVQSHVNRVLQVRGHVFLNDVLDDLGIERCPEGAISGWLYGGEGDDYIDFGFMASQDPQAILFRNFAEKSVQLNFNIDGTIWDKI